MEGPLSSAESSIHEIVTLVANYRTDEALARSQIAVLQKQWEDLRRDQDGLRQQQEEMKRQQEYFRQQQEVARRQEEVYRKQQEVLRSQEDVLRQQEMAVFRQLVDGRVLLDQAPLSLQRALYSAQSRAAEYKNRSALVHLLPTEIVSEIFLTGQHLQLYDPKWKSEKVRFEILVSHVSREWRAIALGTANLWKSASVFLDEPERIHAYLSRSAEALLELNLLSRIETSADELRCIWSVLIAPHLHRVESLSFIYRCPLQLKETLQLLSEACLPSLVHLSVDCPSAAEYFDIHRVEGFNMLAGGAPKLSSLRLNAILPEEGSTYLSSIRTLALTLPPSTRHSQFTSTQHIYSLLPSFIHLTTLSVDNWLPEGPRRRVTLPNLLCFKYGSFNRTDIPDIDALRDFLTTIIMPKVKSFIFEFETGMAVVELFRRLGSETHQEFLHLRDLVFVSQELMSTEVNPLRDRVVRVPSVSNPFEYVENLSLVNLSNTDVTLAPILGVEDTNNSTSFPRLPNLKNLTIGYPFLTPPMLRGILGKREAMGQPIPGLCVPDSFINDVTVFGSPQDIKLFHGQTHVNMERFDPGEFFASLEVLPLGEAETKAITRMGNRYARWHPLWQVNVGQSQT